MVSSLEKSIKIAKSQDFVGDKLKLKKGMKFLSGVVDEGSNRIDTLTSKTSHALR